MSALPGRLVLLGHPVAHSLSPAFQNAALRRAGIPLVYEALDVPPAALDETVGALRAAGAAGNVTIPHKEHVAALCDVRTPLAERVGAVNTFWTDGGRLCGDNTDVGGFDAAARAVLGAAPGERRVALVGAGGSAAAVAAAATAWPGAHVAIWSRTPERAARLAARFAPAAQAVARLGEALAGAALVVNATPVGLHTDEHPVPVAALPPGAAVVDLVYRAGETAWVRAARAAGHPAGDGLTMLVEQGALAFERWFGVAPDRDAMWAAVR